MSVEGTGEEALIRANTVCIHSVSPFRTDSPETPSADATFVQEWLISKSF